MSGEKGKYWPPIISALLVIGIGILGYTVTLVSDLSDKIDKINDNFMEHRLDYAQHKTQTELKIQGLENKE